MKTQKTDAESGHVIINPEMLQIGDQFDQFQILAHVAKGGMSDIYRAYDLLNRREVAIKIPDPSMIGDPAQFERFQRELEVLNTFDHPAIMKGLGSGTYNRIPYLVMQFLEGRSLRLLIEESAPLPCAQALELITKIGEGLAYCHANGVIHRDLKPENIIVTAEGQPVIMDFGLALTRKAHRVTYSNLSATMGTPDYMAPEQIEGQRGDQRTDLYALATILYELLAGQTPFTGDNNLAVMAQHVNNAAPRLDKLQPCVEPGIAAVVATALQREPDRRYPDIQAFLAALEHPEQADLSILERAAGAGRLEKLLRSTAFKATVISLALIGSMVACAIIAQALQAAR
jgi:serine/threonine protein kinase